MIHTRTATTAEYEAIKAQARVALRGIKYVMKRNQQGTTRHMIYIYCREKHLKWNAEHTQRVYDFVLSTGLKFYGETPRRDTSSYSGLSFVEER